MQSLLRTFTLRLSRRAMDGLKFKLSVKGRRVSVDSAGKPVRFVMPRPGRVIGHPMHASPA